MKIFLDTEFTSLESPKLISIGLVAADGQEFYRELTDGWTIAECTMFVLGWVLPWLSDGKAGNRLYAKLGQHLDLIQYECDVDHRFPAAKVKMLMQALQGDMALREHLHFLSNNYDTTELQVWRNKCIADLIGSYRVEGLLSGDQAKSKEQARTDFIDWLKQFPNYEICCDSDYDIRLLKDLIDQQFQWRLISKKSGNPTVSDKNLHHALDDARMMAETYCP